MTKNQEIEYNLTRKSNFSIIKKNLSNKFLSPYAICMIKCLFQPILSQKKWPKMANAIGDKNFFYCLLKNWTSQLKYLQKGRFSELIPLDRNETFSFYHFKSMVFGLGIFFVLFAVSGNRGCMILVLYSWRRTN